MLQHTTLARSAGSAQGPATGPHNAPDASNPRLSSLSISLTHILSLTHRHTLSLSRTLSLPLSHSRSRRGKTKTPHERFAFGLSEKRTGFPGNLRHAPFEQPPHVAERRVVLVRRGHLDRRGVVALLALACAQPVREDGVDLGQNLGLRVWGLGFGIQGSGFRVQGLGRVQGGFRECLRAGEATDWGPTSRSAPSHRAAAPLGEVGPPVRGRPTGVPRRPFG
jgi:hypothetical protein